MYQLQLPEPLEEDIRDYIRKTVYTKALQEEIKEFFDDRINPNLKSDGLTFSHIHHGVSKEVMKLYSRI